MKHKCQQPLLLMIANPDIRGCEKGRTSAIRFISVFSLVWRHLCLSVSLSSPPKGIRSSDCSLFGKVVGQSSWFTSLFINSCNCVITQPQNIQHDAMLDPQTNHQSPPAPTTEARGWKTMENIAWVVWKSKPNSFDFSPRFANVQPWQIVIWTSFKHCCRYERNSWGEEVQRVSQRSTDNQISTSDSVLSVVLGTVGSINA